MTSSLASPAAPAALPDHSVVPPVWSRITNLDIDRGEGSWLISRDGERFLDYSSGIGVTNTGHAHPRVAAAIAAQAAKLLHGQQNILYHEPGLRLHDRLQRLMPGGPWQAFLSNSGAEAVEASIKLARVATGRPAVIAFRYGYHGRTAQTMALTTAKDVYRGAFEPLPGIRVPHGLPVLLSRRRWPALAGRVHVRLGSAARPHVPPIHLSRPGGGRHRRAGARRRWLHRPAARLPSTPPRDHSPARNPADRRRSPDRVRANRRAVRRPALEGRARHPGHGQGDRVGAAAVRDPGPEPS